MHGHNADGVVGTAVDDAVGVGQIDEHGALFVIKTHHLGRFEDRRGAGADAGLTAAALGGSVRGAAAFGDAGGAALAGAAGLAAGLGVGLVDVALLAGALAAALVLLAAAASAGGLLTGTSSPFGYVRDRWFRPGRPWAATATPFRARGL